MQPERAYWLAERLGVSVPVAVHLVMLAEAVCRAGEAWSNEGDKAEAAYDEAQREFDGYVKGLGLVWELPGLCPVVIKNGDWVDIL